VAATIADGRNVIVTDEGESISFATASSGEIAVE
jgi:hypothetical protein